MSDATVPSSDRVIAGFMAYRLTAALKAALDIDLFTAVGEGCVTADALAARCKVEVRGVRILADFLVIRRFLTKENDTYALVEESRLYLDRRSPRYLGKSFSFSMSPVVWEQYGRLTDIVREGGARSQSVALQPNHEMWVQFARDLADDMAGTARLAIPHITKSLGARAQRPLKVLDVAAGHGMFGITFAKEHPTSHVVAQDWPQILEVTREHAVAHGVADRMTTLPGDIMQVDIGTGYDVVMIPNLIHYLGPDTIVQLFKKVRAAMNPGGILAIVEYAPNDDRVWPPFASFALFSLVTSPDGDAYTVNEILRMCWQAGFEQLEYRDLAWERLMLAVNPGTTIDLVVTSAQFPGATIPANATA